MWIGFANEQIFHQFAMFNILGTLYTKPYNQRIMADQQGLRLVTAIPRMEQCGDRMKTGGEPPCIKKAFLQLAQAPTQDYHSYTHALLGVVEEEVTSRNFSPTKHLWPNRHATTRFPARAWREGVLFWRAQREC